jgi:benzoylformate decarboxylase
MATAAKEALSVLKANGITRLFGNPGTTELPLLDATISEGLEFHLCLHEGVATAMADGYGRATGTVGVAMVHTSVGTANTLANLINLRSDRSPLLVIAGDKDDRLMGRGCFCEVPDIAGLARQVTKEAWRVTMPEKFPELLHRGLKVAQASPSGPVFLAVPENYMNEVLAPEQTGRYDVPVARIVNRVHPDDLRTALRVVGSASRPLIIAGNEVGKAQGGALLSQLAEKLCAPVVGEETFTTNGLNFPADHPFYQGNFRPNLPVVRDADVVLAIGARLFMEYDFLPQGHFSPGVTIIQIGSDASELGKLYASDLALLGDVATALSDLVGMLDSASPLEPERKVERIQRATRTERLCSSASSGAEQSHSNQLRLMDLLDALHAILPQNGVIVDESVLSKFAMQGQFPLSGERLYFGTSGGGLGWGMGAAMGIRLGFSDRTVVAFLGDGGSLYNIQGLWTAANMNLPVIFVLVNNGGYMAVRRGLRDFNGNAARTGRYPGSNILDPSIDFTRVAQGFGVQAATVANRPALDEALHWAFALNAPVLLDVHVCPNDYV